MIRKNPWFCLAIVVTLALGMGVNTTVFSLVNAVLHKPLPFPGGERLVLAWAAHQPAGRNTVGVSYADARDFRQAAGSFERLEAFSRRSFTLGESGNPPERYRGGMVTAGIFEMLRTQPVAGRGFQPSDEKPGAPPVVLLGHGVWKDRYGGDPNIAGRVVRVNEKPATIIGVMPEGFAFPDNEQLWSVVVPEAADEDRSRRAYYMIGLLKPGVTPAQAEADLNVIARRLEKQFPNTHKDHGATVLTFHQAMNGGPIRTIFLLMLGAVGFVLLIACANVANMLLSRAVERTREVSIRTAMGAGRWRIVRQLLVESVLLSAIGGLAGLLLARFGIAAFGSAVENVGKPYWIDFSMDYVVFAYFAALTVLAGIVFGIAPALSASRVDLNETLKEGSRSVAGARGGYLSGALVVFQFTLAVVLLSGAGLMMRSFLAAQDEFAGMNGQQVLKTVVSLPNARYPDPAGRQQFFERLMPRLASIPGVRDVAFVSNTPGGGGAGWRFELEGKPIDDARSRPAVSGVVAAPGYLRLLGLSLLQGRDFNDTDGLAGKEAVIVSQNFVSRHFPNQDPIGKRMRIYNSENAPRPWMTIVGVMPEMRQTQPSERMQDPVVLVPYRFESYGGMVLLLRTGGSPAALAPAVRNEVAQIDRDLALYETSSLAEHFARQRWYLRVFGTVFLIFAVIAMGMAAVGIYAVMAHATSRRTREIGVRMALGADVRSILRLVLGRGLIQLALGMVLGIVAALAVCRLMSGLLFGVSAADPLTFVTVALALGAAGLAATWFPARRAARLDPVRALRYE